MKSVKLEIFAGSESIVKEINLDDDKTVRDLLTENGIDEINEYIVIINGVNTFDSYILQHGDRVKVFPAMSGG
ncbi:MAG: hypothetical protein HPY66_3372 [Firmicutes bacterium]|nr:hypothetical protein [Bacillota bacterium]MDI6706284.1 MoaD/ThiS family protein [Bacillota bacterium]